MKVLFTPQRPLKDGRRIHYNFNGNSVTVEMDGIVETIDLSKWKPGYETKLPVNPVFSVQEKDGELYVELLNFIGEDATFEERFPDWIDV